MINEDRQQKINELKALRAELLAIKETQEGESGVGSANNEALKKMRDEYVTDAEQSVREDDRIVDVRQEIYNQYEKDKDDLDNTKQKVLTRKM